MLTIVATARAFYNHHALIQRNAIQSWLALTPKCEIILIGDDPGTKAVADEYHIAHKPDIAYNGSGLKLMDSFLDIAQRSAHFNIMAWLSADIILMSDFLPAITRIKWPKFLMSAQRWDLDIQEEINFSDAHWEQILCEKLRKNGTLHPPTSGDVLVFNRGLFQKVPPFLIGRALHDNWIFYYARSLGLPFIDATKAMTVVHQNHAYDPQKNWDWKNARDLQHPDYLYNLELAGGISHLCILTASNWVLTPKGLKRALLTKQGFIRWLDKLFMCYPSLKPLRWVIDILTSFGRKIK